jgi:hypothetical protein
MNGTLLRRLTPGLTLGSIAAALACSSSTTPSAASLDAPGAASADAGLRGAHAAELAALREATNGFRDFTLATTTGRYATAITGCMTDPTQGGMGFHYARTELLDASLDVRTPEALLYEPQKNGRMTLVAVEYLVPFTAWTASTPPTIMGQPLLRNEAFQVWARHVWLYRDNPSGLFADWNPRVNCRFAPAGTTTAMQH